jgi:Fic family protein
METREYLNLKKVEGVKFYYIPSKIEDTEKSLDSFLCDKKHLFTKSFAKTVMFSHEIKANNQVEGYGDDVSVIEEVIHKCANINDVNQRQRITNLYHGYNYILKEKNIDKETLRKLYIILSKDLLCLSDKSKMGEYYRQNKVYILRNGRLDIEPDEGINYELINQYMDILFNFINNTSFGDEYIKEYIKSQIMHCYFVYIHPYFDVNGRTSRTMSMWYLLNKEAYPYIIFNRGISFNSSYDKEVRKAHATCNLTSFLKYMLETLRSELEKELIMQKEASYSKEKLTSTDYQTMLYLLSLKGNVTIADFARMYNYYNSKKNIKDIYANMITPLVQKGILELGQETNKELFDGQYNRVLSLVHFKK